MDRMTDDQFKLLLRHLQVIIAILGIIAGTLLALAWTYPRTLPLKKAKACQVRGRLDPGVRRPFIRAASCGRCRRHRRLISNG